jgi:UDP-glucuronate 4-epimerase
VRALVTGCAGFIGSHLAQSLLGQTVEVIGVDGFTDNYGRELKLRNLEPLHDWRAFRFVEADLSQHDSRALVADCDVIFHLAAEPGVRTSWGSRFANYTRNNILTTQRLLEAAKESFRGRLIYASSSSVYGQAERRPTPESVDPKPRSPYGVTKLAAEHLCQLYHWNHGVESVALRYFSVFGPCQRPDMAFNRFCRAAIEDESITLFGDGTQTRDFTFVSDVVSATEAAATASSAAGQTYNIGGGREVSLNAAIDLISEFVGGPLKVCRSAPEYGDVKSTSADTSRARADLGWVPTVEFENGLRAEFDWIRANAELSGRVGD